MYVYMCVDVYIYIYIQRIVALKKDRYSLSLTSKRKKLLTLADIMNSNLPKKTSLCVTNVSVLIVMNSLRITYVLMYM